MQVTHILSPFLPQPSLHGFISMQAPWEPSQGGRHQDPGLNHPHQPSQKAAAGGLVLSHPLVSSGGPSILCSLATDTVEAQGTFLIFSAAKNSSPNKLLPSSSPGAPPALGGDDNSSQERLKPGDKVSEPGWGGEKGGGAAKITPRSRAGQERDPQKRNWLEAPPCPATGTLSPAPSQPPSPPVTLGSELGLYLLEHL